jgi:LmbE family N-acetylglucosaminyl deacetylase
MVASALKRHLRFRLLAVLRCVLRWRSAPLAFRRGEVVVVIAPHPDDETFGCGLLLAQPPISELTMHVIFLTRGEGSHSGHPELTPAALAELRSREAAVAASLLGVPPAALHFLDLPDGRLAHLTEAAAVAAADRIAALLDRLKPTVVLVPDPRDGSTEHTAAFHLLEGVATRPGIAWRRLAYLVWSAWSPRLLARIAFGGGRIRRHLAGAGTAAKWQAALAYRSQTAPAHTWKHAVLPMDFVAALARDDEFYIEIAT